MSTFHAMFFSHVTFCPCFFLLTMMALVAVQRMTLQQLLLLLLQIDRQLSELHTCLDLLVDSTDHLEDLNAGHALHYLQLTLHNLRTAILYTKLVKLQIMFPHPAWPSHSVAAFSLCASHGPRHWIVQQCLHADQQILVHRILLHWYLYALAVSEESSIAYSCGSISLPTVRSEWKFPTWKRVQCAFSVKAVDLWQELQTTC